MKTLPKTYPIHERFYTFQGEGDHMGRAAFFIRTFGCPVHCPWCDAAGTWHPDHVPEQIDRMSAAELVSEIINEGADTNLAGTGGIVVITGGEPAVHDLSDLVKRIKGATGLPVHLETSGAFPIEGDYDWITLSPKKWRHPLRANVQYANEYKIIVEEPDDIHFYHGLLMSLGLEQPTKNKKSVWLHPEWTHRDDMVVKKAIVEAVKAGGPTFRAGWQLHKLYVADMHDSRSKPLVPIGGDPKKGF